MMARGTNDRAADEFPRSQAAVRGLPSIALRTSLPGNRMGSRGPRGRTYLTSSNESSLAPPLGPRKSWKGLPTRPISSARSPRFVWPPAWPTRRRPTQGRLARMWVIRWIRPRAVAYQ